MNKSMQSHSQAIFCSGNRTRVTGGGAEARVKEYISEHYTSTFKDCLSSVLRLSSVSRNSLQ